MFKSFPIWWQHDSLSALMKLVSKRTGKSSKRRPKQFAMITMNVSKFKLRAVCRSISWRRRTRWDRSLSSRKVKRRRTRISKWHWQLEPTRTCSAALPWCHCCYDNVIMPTHLWNWVDGLDADYFKSTENVNFLLNFPTPKERVCAQLNNFCEFYTAVISSTDWISVACL